MIPEAGLRAAPIQRPSGINEQNPWPGLESFDEPAQRFFNGRTNEAVELRRLVLTAPLSVLFGGSGLGKTSLLHAGLFPLLRKDDVLPIYVRLDVTSQTEPLIEQLKRAMDAQFREHHVDTTAMETGASLWEWLHRETLELWSRRNRPVMPLFVLDQFEEVYTLGAKNTEAIAQLRTDLADLAENRIPDSVNERIREGDLATSQLAFATRRYKILLSFREDFLPSVEGWKKDIPSIMTNRLRLLPMSLRQAFQAVHDTAPHLVDEATAGEIVHFVANSQNDTATNVRVNDITDADAWVEPALLSLVCSGLNEQRKSKGKSVIDCTLVQNTGKEIVRDYYLRTIAGVSAKTRRFVEEQLITARGFRRPCDVDDARTVHGVPAAELRLLVDSRLLRIEPQRQTDMIELTHDLLTGVVREHRDRRRSEAKARKRLVIAGAVVAVLFVLVMSAGVWLNTQQRSLAVKEIEFREVQEAADATEQAVEQLRQENYDARQKLEAAIQSMRTLSATIASPERTRAVSQTLDSVQRELKAAPPNADPDTARRLAEQLNDPSEQVRKAAGGRLARENSANPIAVRSVLETLSEENLPALSAAGRINALYFLSRADPAAWTEVNKALAQAAIVRIRNRAAQGVAIGNQTNTELERLEKRLAE